MRAASPRRRRAVRIAGEISALRKRLGIVDGLAARGVRSADIAELADHAVRDACIVTNPRHASAADVRAIYGEAI